jgi:molecular chaperone GrpE
MTERKSKHTHTETAAAESASEMPEEIVGSFREEDQDAAQSVQDALPVVSMEEYEALKKSLEQAEAKSKEYFDGWQRERADFSNYKKRVDREQAMLSQNIAAEIIKKYLMVLDDMDRAMKMRPSEGDITVWASGFELIYRKLQNILDAENIKRIPAENEDFNPLRHEAISFEESQDHESGQIIGVVQEGYTLGDRVIRPARVRVAR